MHKNDALLLIVGAIFFAVLSAKAASAAAHALGVSPRLMSSAVTVAAHTIA